MTTQTFEGQLEAFARAVGKSLNQTCKGITIKWFQSTILSTPVDTGRARGNWQMTLGVPAVGVIDRTDKTGTTVISDVRRMVGGVGSVNYLTNNLEYVSDLEYGSSTQAPEGMVRVNHARITAIIEEVARGNRV